MKNVQRMINLKSQTLVYGSHYCYCSKFLFVLTNKHFYYKINYFVVNKKKMLTKYVILLMVVFWGSSEFSHPTFS